MNITYDRSFSKSLDKIKLKKVKTEILKFISTAKDSSSVNDISSVRKLAGYRTFYRYRFGDYRIGFELVNKTTINLIVIAKRNDIYKKFP